jgi:hypothetical protein
VGIDSILEYCGRWEHLSELKAFNMEKNCFETWQEFLEKLLVRREGCLPPSEMTYPIHECVHVATSQILCMGPCPSINLFPFERANLCFKRHMKNSRYPVSSIVRNHLVDECHMFEMLSSQEGVPAECA